MLLSTLLIGGLLMASSSLAKMEYIRVAWSSVDKELGAGVYLPPGYSEEEGPYPCLYFLHGMNGSERKYAQRGVPSQLDQMIESGELPPLLVICPDGQNSMYVNWHDGKAPWEDFIAEDLVAAIDERFATADDPELRGITGDSMGGYGALLIAFQNPDVFGSVSAHSAALYSVNPEELPDWIKQRGERWKPIYGHPVDRQFWESKNPLHLAEHLPEDQLSSLEIYFDVGDQDRFGFHRTGSQLSSILSRRKIDHEYHLRKGGHGTEYFQTNVAHSLLFHSKLFRPQASEQTQDDE
jgi:S-formylglutathione hydrolase FrmB